MTDTSFEIDGSWIDGEDLIDSRLASIDEESREAVQLVLRYLFVNGGPVSIERSIKVLAEEHLSPVEAFVLQWLHKRTDGKLRRHYGPGVLDAVKRSRYQCERCGFRDVRALNLEKAEASETKSDTKSDAHFVCLCANCNTVAARAKEMAAVALERELAAKAAAEAEAAAKAEEAEIEAMAETEAVGQTDDALATTSGAETTDD